MDGLLEPYLIKAINLLHSKSKDSGDQLKSMLDEAIRLRNDSTNSSSKISPSLMNVARKDLKKKVDVICDEDIPLSKRRKESPRTSQPSSPATSLTGRSKENKRKYDVFNDEDSSKKSSSLPSSPVVGSPPASRSSSPNGVRKSEDSDSLIDADDLTQEIMDLHCVICNGLAVSSGNQLVECQECHGLYHQECHSPSITDNEVNDPRLVWYCSKCCKTMKKTTSKPKSVGNRESPITFGSKYRSDSPNMIGKTSVSNTSNNTKSGPSKNSNTKSTSSSSSSSTSSSSGNSTNVNSSLISADKRLQIIKKRAATKLQEKRKITK